MALTFNAIFLGNSATQLDPTEGNDLAEGAGFFATQTFGGPGNALAGQWVSFTSVNNGGVATALDMNNSVVNDLAIINDGSGPVTYTFDGTSVFFGFITYIDGSTSPLNLQMVLVQMTNGDLYLVPRPTAGDPTNAWLSTDQIQSITFTGLVGDTYSGMDADRPVISFLTCFASGTRISTPEGERPVEALAPGDLVNTQDNGPQPVLWIGHRHVSLVEMFANPQLRPIRIAAGSMGKGVPSRDLRVSPQHRMLVRSAIAERMFGAPEVMVAAKHLVGLPGIGRCPRLAPIDYWHLLCERHEILFADNAPAESFYTGTQALYALEEGARAELQAVFGNRTPPLPARNLVAGRKGRSLARRHGKHGHQLLMTQA